MSSNSLSLPVDIPWQRVCVTTDMLDPADGKVENVPPLWQSSLALFRYVPPEEYQLYPGRRIIYYKLTCTISNYQPKSDQLAGTINLGDVIEVGKIENADLQEIFSTSLPCTGAIVQVSVSPAEAGRSIDTYPYFLEVQPRQRALYEQVTESQEKTSRSLESLQVRKDAGSSNSLEVVDKDTGGSLGAFSVEGKRSVDQGTQSLGKQDSQLITTIDGSREARETLSFTTQLSQMYTLLQAYHLGTNRVFFYIAPRPYMKDTPTGLAGPRKLDGIQDFFLVVSQAQEDAMPCITARLDTGHLYIKPLYDYDRSEPPKTLSVNIETPAPIRDDPAATETDDGSSAFYQCIYKSSSSKDSLNAPSGYVIESISDIENTTSGHSGLANSSQVVPPSPIGGRQVTLIGTATGYACHRNAAGDDANAAALGILKDVGLDIWGETWTSEPGKVRRTISVSFRSEVQSKQIGEQYVLTLTARQLRCCDKAEIIPPKIVATVSVPNRFLSGDVPQAANRNSGAGMSLGVVNELQHLLAEETKRLSSLVIDPMAAPSLDSEFLSMAFVDNILPDPRRRAMLAKPATSLGLSQKQIAQIAEGVGRPGKMLNCAEILTAPPKFIESITGVKGEEMLYLRLKAAGIVTNKSVTKKSSSNLEE